ncbi:MAG: DUF2270 domain-containing protein [Myxococcota bacterium]|nr:DUF2270 domain-containing protein [Myxococcota bacterium]
MTGIRPQDAPMILTHYYRAMVGRADIWRTRMDTTTNWAIGATAAIMSFALGNSAVPHYVVFIASLMTLSFLMLEARRLTFYHLWQQRVLLLEQGLIRPAAFALGSAQETIASTGDRDLAQDLEIHLGRTAPTMPLGKAVARRLRRVYLYLFGVQLLAWVLKISNHPTASTSANEWIARAHVGSIPGGVFLVVMAALFLAATGIAIARGGTDRR